MTRRRIRYVVVDASGRASRVGTIEFDDARAGDAAEALRASVPAGGSVRRLGDSDAAPVIGALTGTIGVPLTDSSPSAA